MGSTARWSQADLRAHQAKRETEPRQKYRNKFVTVDGIGFQSKKESDHYLLLKMRERMHEIEDLKLQPVFPLYVITPQGHRVAIGDFTPDFRYFEHYCGEMVLRVVDVKSAPTKTEAYQLRKKMAEALYGITIIEV